ncbi:MAG TPA: hypothetical protein VNJ46_07010 [Gaiellaceae bacterium]|nr:hypothetical protein [Gaiellaceae bacterium]
MRTAWARLLALVPTRRGAALLFAAALAVYAVEAAGWPLAKGRDTWDYLAYYLQLADADPPLSFLQVFRTPLTPLVLGVPLDLGGALLLEAVFGLLYAAAIVAWAGTALVFGRIPALAAGLLLLAYPAYATLYHQASSDAVFATSLAVWALLLARALDRPAAARFAAVGAGIAVLALIRPANQVLLPLALVPLAASAPWPRRARWAALCAGAALVPLALWAGHNALRYDEPTVARGGKAWVPFLRVFLADRTIAPENGPASLRLGRLIEREVLAREPYHGLGVSLDEYLRNGSNYEVVRLIALSDRVLGREEEYAVLFDSALEAIRAHPGTYLSGVADVFWQFLLQRPLREDVRPRRQSPSAPYPATIVRDGVRLPNPAAHVLLLGVPYGFVWCAADELDACVARRPARVWRDPGRQRRYRELVARVREWDAELPSRAGVDAVTEILNRVTPRFPRPPLWLAVGALALAWRRPRGSRTVLALWLAAGLVLAIHAASQGVAPEFALPLYPIFIVTALGALAGEREAPRLRVAARTGPAPP